MLKLILLGFFLVGMLMQVNGKDLRVVRQASNDISPEYQKLFERFGIENGQDRSERMDILVTFNIISIHLFYYLFKYVSNPLAWHL